MSAPVCKHKLNAELILTLFNIKVKYRDLLFRDEPFDEHLMKITTQRNINVVSLVELVYLYLKLEQRQIKSLKIHIEKSMLNKRLILLAIDKQKKKQFNK